MNRQRCATPPLPTPKQARGGEGGAACEETGRRPQTEAANTDPSCTELSAIDPSISWIDPSCIEDPCPASELLSHPSAPYASERPEIDRPVHERRPLPVPTLPLTSVGDQCPSRSVGDQCPVGPADAGADGTPGTLRRDAGAAASERVRLDRSTAGELHRLGAAQLTRASCASNACGPHGGVSASRRGDDAADIERIDESDEMRRSDERDGTIDVNCDTSPQHGELAAARSETNWAEHMASEANGDTARATTLSRDTPAVEGDGLPPDDEAPGVPAPRGAGQMNLPRRDDGDMLALPRTLSSTVDSDDRARFGSGGGASKAAFLLVGMASSASRADAGRFLDSAAASCSSSRDTLLVRCRIIPLILPTTRPPPLAPRQRGA